MLERFGMQMGFATMQRSNWRERAASASRWGVRTVGLPPKPVWSARCWSVIRNRKLGRSLMPRFYPQGAG